MSAPHLYICSSALQVYASPPILSRLLVVAEVGKAFPTELSDLLQEVKPSVIVITPAALSAKQRKDGMASVINPLPSALSRGATWQIEQTAQVGTIEFNCTDTPPAKARGGSWFHEATCHVAPSDSAVAVASPQAFHETCSSVSLCPRVPSKAFARMFRAAFSSLSSTNPHVGQMCVRMERDFLTRVRHVEQSWEVQCGSMAMTGIACSPP